MARSTGVLPDSVIRDYRANAYFVFLTLQDHLPVEGVQAWLRALTDIIRGATAETVREPRRRRVHLRRRRERVMTIATGLGQRFFFLADAPRFGVPVESIPDGIRVQRDLNQGVDLKAESAAADDVILYVMSTSEAAFASLLRRIEDTRPLGLGRIASDRGFQRKDRRELFGFLDGLRNAKNNRAQSVFIDRDLAPQEPPWTDGGTYAVYLKIQQHLGAFDAIPDKERLIGRRMADGSRLDLPAGTKAKEEPPTFTSDEPPKSSHVRKAGPRGVHDSVEIFRRGVPYADVTREGVLEAGLQFVSFQRSLDRFETIFQRWMQNPDFPDAGTQPDQLLTRGVVSIKKGGIYFVPPSGGDYIASGLFGPQRRPAKSPEGRLIIRKRAFNPDGSRALTDLSGITFQFFRDGSPASDPFSTDSAGHAASPEVEAGTYELRDTAPSQFEPQPARTVTIERRSQLERIDNRLKQPGYGG